MIDAPGGTVPDNENVSALAGRSASPAVAVKPMGPSSEPDWGPMA